MSLYPPLWIYPGLWIHPHAHSESVSDPFSRKIAKKKIQYAVLSTVVIIPPSVAATEAAAAAVTVVAAFERFPFQHVVPVLQLPPYCALPCLHKWPPPSPSCHRAPHLFRPLSLPPLFPSTPLPRPSQVDGPWHFVALAGGGRRPNGATLLKRRLLGRVGWRVVSVPHWEWEACAGPADQAEYLRCLVLPG
jgi:hypothetical protein